MSGCVTRIIRAPIGCGCVISRRTRKNRGKKRERLKGVRERKLDFPTNPVELRRSIDALLNDRASMSVTGDVVSLLKKKSVSLP